MALSPTAARTRLSQAVSSALIFFIASPYVSAATLAASQGADPEQDAQARQAAYAQRLPDLGSDIPAAREGGAAALGEAVEWLAQGGSGRDLSGRAVNAGLDYGLDAARASGLPFLGSLQGGLSYNTALDRFDFDLLTMLALYGNGEGHVLLGQLGAHNQRDRQTLNAGLVYRWIDPQGAYLLGGSLFYDRDLDAGAPRVGLGVEAATANLRVFANGYAPVGGWVTSPNDDLLEERPARGYDLGVSYTPPKWSMLDVQAKGSKWRGDAVDVFGTGQTEANPTVWSARLGLAPVQALALALEHSFISGGQEDTRVSLTYTHQFGVPAAQQWRWKGGAPRNDVRARAMAPVERENRVIMDTREKVAAPAFASASVVESVYEGEAFTHTLAVTGGALPLRYALGGADAGRFTLSGATLQLPAQDASAPADAGADNTYDAIVTVTDARGRSATQRVAVTVRAAAPTAQNLRIEGTAQVGSALTLAYDYHSPLGETEDRDGRRIQWFRQAPQAQTMAVTTMAAGAAGDIAGATGATYVPVEADKGYELGARLIVRSQSGRHSAELQAVSPVVDVALGHAPTAKPALSGAPVVGATLTGTVGYADADGDAEGTHRYQWYRASDAAGTQRTAIAGANETTYTVTAADRGHYVVFEVTPVAVTGMPNTGVPTIAVTASAIGGEAPTATPSIQGEPAIDAVLTGVVGYADAEGDAEGVHTYQWYRADDAAGQVRVAVAGATTTTYTVTTADQGKYLVFEVIPVALTGDPKVGQPTRAVTRVTADVPGTAPEAYPSIGGTAKVGSVLTGTSGYFDDDGDAESGTSYQWYRTDAAGTQRTAIAGATAPAYTVVGADQGYYLALEVVPRSATGVPSVGAVAYTKTHATVTGTAPTANPAIQGTLAIGQTVTAVAGYADADGDAEGTHLYTWYRSDDASGTSQTIIPGALDANYTIQAADIGKYLGVFVTPVSATGDPKQGVPTAVVAATPVDGHAPTAAPTIEGTAKVGQTLTGRVNFQDADGDGEGVHTYQWYRASDAAGTQRTAIGGAYRETYTVAAADVGQYLVFEVTPKSATGSPAQGAAAQAVSGQVAGMAPTANPTVTLSGARVVGNAKLTADAGYADAENDPAGAHSYQWYRADKADGTGKVAIAGATNIDYTPTPDDQGKHLLVEVTPRSANGEAGTATLSSSGVAMPFGEWNPQAVLSGVSGYHLRDVIVAGRPDGVPQRIRFEVGRANMASANSQNSVRVSARYADGPPVYHQLPSALNGTTVELEVMVSDLTSVNGRWVFNYAMGGSLAADSATVDYVTVEFLD